MSCEGATKAGFCNWAARVAPAAICSWRTTELYALLFVRFETFEHDLQLNLVVAAPLRSLLRFPDACELKTLFKEPSRRHDAHFETGGRQGRRSCR